MGYDAEKHGNSEGKLVARQDTSELIMDCCCSKANKKANGIMMPAKKGVQEKDLLQRMSEEGIECSLTCVEKDVDTFQYTKELPLKNTTFVNSKFEDFSYPPRSFDFFFLDFCGNLLLKHGYKNSAMEIFVKSLKSALKNKGIGFITFSMFGRLITGDKMYEMLTGKKVKDVTYNQMMKAYIIELKKYLPDNYHICYSLQYTSGNDKAFGVIGVSKGYEAKPKHVDLIENFASNEIENDPFVKDTLEVAEIVQASSLDSRNVEDWLKEEYPNASKRTLKSYTSRLAKAFFIINSSTSLSRKDRRRLKKSQQVEIIVNPKKSKTEKVKADKIKARQDRKDLKDFMGYIEENLPYDEIKSSMDMEPKMLQGLKSSIVKSNRGDANASKLHSYIVRPMFKKGMSDEKIFKACTWLGFNKDEKKAKSKLAGLKAGYTRHCNKNGIDFKFPKKNPTASVKKEKKATPAKVAKPSTECGGACKYIGTGKNSFTDEDNRLIIKLKDEDATDSQIARALGRSNTSVCYHIKKNFIKEEMPSTECVTPEYIHVWDGVANEQSKIDGKVVETMLNENNMQKDIAEHFGVHFSTISAYIKRHIKKIPRSEMIKELDARTKNDRLAHLINKTEKLKEELEELEKVKEIVKVYLYQPIPELLMADQKEIDGQKFAKMINEGYTKAQVGKHFGLTVEEVNLFYNFHIRQVETST